jgi:solute carrier family 13 (sodium-dependent dicarboxylate transporter), member 2/3/5
MPTAVDQTFPVHSAQSSSTTYRKLTGSVLTVAIPVALWFAPLHLELTAKHALAISAFMIVAWIFEVMPHALAGLIGCYLYWALGVASFPEAFSGFSDNATWFVFGAVLFGTMATKSGLARRLAYLVMGRVGPGYSRLLLGFVLTSFVLTFLVPSGIACIVIMASVALGFMEVFGLGQGSNIGRGMFITLTYTAGALDKMVIAGPSVILGRGLIEKGTGVAISYSLWFWAFLPISLLTILFIWRLAVRMYPPEEVTFSGGSQFIKDELQKMGPWTGAEKKALTIMLLAILLWMTDMIHHLSPVLIGLGAGLVGAIPGIGVLDHDDLKKTNYLPVFFVAASLSMGNILVETKALAAMIGVMFGWMQPLMVNIFAQTQVAYWAAFLYHILLGNELAMLATSLPGLLSFAKAHGIHPLPLGMVWGFAAGGKIFVYQSAVMIAGYSYGYFDGKDLIKVGTLVTLVQGLLLLILVPFYWPLIGIR